MPALKNMRHERFAVARFNGLSGTAAATVAGYSRKSASVQASRVLRNVTIQSANGLRYACRPRR